MTQHEEPEDLEAPGINPIEEWYYLEACKLLTNNGMIRPVKFPKIYKEIIYVKYPNIDREYTFESFDNKEYKLVTITESKRDYHD